MLQFRSGAGVVVAADTKNTVCAVDDALLNGLRMYASVLEATKESNLPVAQSQKLFSSMNSGLAQVLAGRADIVDTIRLLTQIKGESNFAVESYGCPDGWVPLTAAQPQESVAA